MAENNDVIKYIMNETFTNSQEKDTSIAQKYHTDAIKTAQIVLNVAMGMFIAITVFIGVIIIYMLNKDLNFSEMLIPLITTTVTDFLSVTIINIMKDFLKSKEKFFERNDENEKLNKAIGLIQTVKDEKSRNKMIDKIIDKMELTSKNIDNKKSDK